LRDLGEALSVEDVYDIIEVAMIDGHNNKAIADAQKRQQ
jgi:hypothetical protein